jgi:hypothetical protein
MSDQPEKKEPTAEDTLKDWHRRDRFAFMSLVLSGFAPALIGLQSARLDLACYSIVFGILVALNVFNIAYRLGRRHDFQRLHIMGQQHNLMVQQYNIVCTSLGQHQELVAKLREALLWCSGSNDFQKGGKARVGWETMCAPLLDPPRPPVAGEIQVKRGN